MDISLLHAGLAAGAALAAVPVILHLFMKQTPRRVIFPALQLIKERQKRSRKKLRIKNWLLLLARMALLALMALALARPALNSQASLGDREVPTALALVFDTSLSMQYEDRGKSRLAEARRRAGEVLSKTHATSQVFVVDSAEPGPPRPMTPAAARKAIDALALKPSNHPLNVAVGLAYRAVADSDRPRHEVYVLTDLARSSWQLDRAVEGLDATRKVKNGIATYVLGLTPKEIRDVAVVEALPATDLATQGEPLKVTARLRCTGPAQQRVAEFYLDGEPGRPAKREQKLVDLPADGEVVVEFKTPSLAAGLHQGEVRLAMGVDPLGFDDRRFFSFQVQPSLKVLVVGDREADRVFVAEALDPDRLPAGTPRPFRVTTARSSELGTRLKESSKGYACVFLLDVEKLADADWSRLTGYVREGGGLVIAPGERADPASYDSPIAAQVVPATLEKPVKARAEMTFGKADLLHPLFARFGKDLVANLSMVPIFQYWGIKPAKASRTLLSYGDGAPALVERTFPGSRTGRVLLWTTPLSRRPTGAGETGNWNEFPVPSFWSFFYLVNQTVPYLAGTVGERLNYEAGQDAVIPIDPARRVSSYIIQGPSNSTSYPLSPLVSNPSLMIQAPQVLGQWTVTGSGAGGRQALGFSVNPPLSETEVVPLKPVELDTLFGKGKYALAEDSESLKREVGKARVGHELFPWLMALILALVTAENFLANTFYRERPSAR